MKKLLFLLLIPLLFISCLPTQKMIVIPNTYAEYDLEKFNDLYLISVTLNGKRTKLLVDTGANKSLLDINKCDYFGYRYSTKSITKYIGIGGATDIYIMYNYNIDLFFVSFLGADLADIAKYFKQDGNKIAGILGSDFLTRTGAIIDYNTNKLYLETGRVVFVNPIGKHLK